jgi:N-acetylmuramoyl-L-alanine amidase
MGKRLFFIAFLTAFLASPPVSAQDVRVVVIDPGHGGYDTGIKVKDLREKDIAHDIAREMQDILGRLERKVHLSRKIDQYVSLEERRALANRMRPDMFVSIHLSGSDAFAVYVNWYDEGAGEISLKEYYSSYSRQRRYLYESGVFAGTVEKILKKTYDSRVYHRELPLPLLGYIGAPSVLIEVPYGVLEGEEYEREVMRAASAIVLGILYYEHER